MRSWNINHPVSVEGHDGGTSQRKDGERKSMHLHSFIPPTARELIGFALFPPVLTSHYEPWFRMEPGGHITLSAGGRWLLKPDAAAAICLSLATWSSLTACPGGWGRLGAKTRCHSEPASTRRWLPGKWKYLFPCQLPCVQVLWRGFPRGAVCCPYPARLLAGRRRAAEEGSGAESLLMPPPLTLWGLSSSSSQWQAHGSKQGALARAQTSLLLVKSSSSRVLV